MIIDSTFWVAVSFLIFVGVVFYFKVPQKVNESLEENIKKIKEEVDHTVLDYKKVIFLVIIMIFYGLTILRAGFFLSTSFFLLFAYYFLGERRWKLMLVFSFPFVALFVFLLHGVLDIYLRDPFLKYIGIMG